jgi:pSer/pThr/pTyr-binding forkhead associated (FHA) protein
MPVCPHCNHEYRAGLVYCDQCGERVVKVASDNTQTTQPVDVALEEYFARVRHSILPISDECLFVFDNSSAESVFLPYAKPATIGRRDTSGPLQADIDLTRYGAFEYGVSRIHAALYRTEDTLSIIDLNSRNGTFLNGIRLGARVPYVLRNGDEIWFAKLAVHIYFKEMEFVR